MQRAKKYSLDNNIIFLILLCLIPISQVFSYIISKDMSVDYIAYPSIIIFYFLVNKKINSIKSAIVVIIFLIYTFFFSNNNLTGRAGYMIGFVLTIASLLILPDIYFYKKFYRKIFIDRVMVVLCYSIMVIYFLTGNIWTDVSGTRNYFSGYIIPHAFSYYMSVFVYYFLMCSKKRYAIFPFLSGVLMGTRTGFLINFISLAAFFFTLMSRNNIINIFKFIIISIIILLILFTFIPELRLQLLNIGESLSIFLTSLVGNNNDLEDNSSRRSLLFTIGFNQIKKDGFAIENIIGRGPRSSYEFIGSTTGMNLWFHNDLVEIMYSLGIVNLILYLLSIFYYCIKTKSFFFFLYLFIAILLNGFFLYASFTIIAIHYLAKYSLIHDFVS